VDSLPAARTVRRTVRVAVALVVGQALLVGLIGWLTFGRADGSGGHVDPMAARPATPPPTTAGRYADPAASRGASAASSPTAKRATHRPQAPATAPGRAPLSPPEPDPAPPPPATEAPVVPEPAPTIVATPTTVPPALVPVVPSAPIETPAPVMVGDPCRPEGAYAYTADGLLVRCARTWHHRLRWKIV
jgi:hypothetical protein